MFNFNGRTPIELGVTNGKLKSSPDTPNCVNSMDTNKKYYIKPLNAKITVLKKLLGTMKNVEIISASEKYLYATFKSKFWGFIDDVEFYANKSPSVLQVRSASRIGYSDLGANRSRIEYIRKELKPDVINEN